MDASDFKAIYIDDEITGLRRFKSDGKAFRRAEFFHNDVEVAIFGNITGGDKNIGTLRVNDGKLIGFHTISGVRDEQPQMWVIKSIAPIVDA